MNHVPLDAQEPALRQFVLALAQDPGGTLVELNGRPVAWVVPVPANTDDQGNWTEAKNDRRCALIDREIDGTLTPGEVVELHSLQDQMLRQRRRVAPLPLADARALHRQLLAEAEPESKS